METINELLDKADERATRALDQSQLVLDAALSGEIPSKDEIRQKVEAKSKTRELQSRYVSVLALSRARGQTKYRSAQG